MALSKAEVRNAFREVAMRELSTIPPKETIDHSFSKQFYEKMVSLIAEQKRGSWRLLSRQRRRALVVAAILVLSMLLVACTPTLRNAVSDFVVSVYERFVEYDVNVDLRSEIDDIYSIKKGFVIVEQKWVTPKFVETTYQDGSGNIVVFSQAATRNVGGSVDKEQGEVMTLTGSNVQILVYSSKTLTTASWIYDGYHMKISYFGEVENDVLKALVESVSLVE